MVKLFVGNISREKIDEATLKSVFETYGEVTEAIVMGSYGFVHMTTKEAANEALRNLNNTYHSDCQLKVELSQPKKKDDVKLFIGNLDKNKITPQQLESAFERYGSVSECVVVGSYGFVHMNSRNEAERAIKALDNTQVGECVIQVKLSTGVNRARGDDHRGHGGGPGGHGGPQRPSGYGSVPDYGPPRPGYGGGGRYHPGAAAPPPPHYPPYYDPYRRGPPPPRDYPYPYDPYYPPPPRDPYYDARDPYYPPPPRPSAYPPPRGAPGAPASDPYYGAVAMAGPATERKRSPPRHVGGGGGEQNYAADYAPPAKRGAPEVSYRAF